ncbi:hypothetical protein HAX54_022002, partial [Datura stramonium]|nr:hypothetical protein [Datura stramonium]
MSFTAARRVLPQWIHYNDKWTAISGPLQQKCDQCSGWATRQNLIPSISGKSSIMSRGESSIGVYENYGLSKHGPKRGHCHFNVLTATCTPNIEKKRKPSNKRAKREI